jgi:thiamine-phosphate pyrophosphorylase
VTLDLASPVVYLITRGESTPENFDRSSREILEIIRVAVEEGVPLVQIREKGLTERLLFELTQMATEKTRASWTRLLVNDRADIALAAGADGVHLAANSLPLGVMRCSFPSDFLIGVSTHNINEARNAAEQGADFAVLGPVFDTPGKSDPLGLQTFGEVCRELRPFPVLALGGVDETNSADVLEVGAYGFAAIRSLNDIDGLSAIVRKLSK